MKPIESMLAFAAGAAFVSALGCGASRTYVPVTTTGATVAAPVTPNAGATLDVRLERIEVPSDLDTAVYLRADHLAAPSAAAPGATVYKVWIQSEGGGFQSLGSVVPDENGRAVLDTVAPKDRFKILITPESGNDVTSPTNPPVLVSDVKIR